MIYRKVNISDRYPYKDGMYLTDQGPLYWGGGWITTALYSDPSPDYWLEPVDIPTKGDISDIIDTLKWVYDEVDNEHQPDILSACELLENLK